MKCVQADRLQEGYGLRLVSMTSAPPSWADTVEHCSVQGG